MSDKKPQSSSQWSPASILVHSASQKPDQGDSFNSPVCFASTFQHAGDVDASQYQYARFHNPTWHALESTLGDLESASAVIFPSGMAAIASVLMTTLQAGDSVLMQSDGYYASRAFVESYLTPLGIQLITLPSVAFNRQELPKTKLVLLESPSNPLLDVIDIKHVANICNSHQSLLAIDNTLMTPLAQQPLELGADFSIYSDTKAINGHSDVLFGHVCSRDNSYVEKIMHWRKLSGSIPGPMEAWLVHRGLSTLDMRLERMCNNAGQIADFLTQQKQVLEVRYPGLKGDPSFQLANQQMQLPGYVISFDLGSKSHAQQFLSRLELVSEATSFGGLHSLAERRARWGTDNVSEGLIRLSVGCESSQDLMRDLSQALKNC